MQVQLRCPVLKHVTHFRGYLGVKIDHFSPDLPNLDIRYESTSHTGHSWRNFWDTWSSIGIYRNVAHIPYFLENCIVLHVPGCSSASPFCPDLGHSPRCPRPRHFGYWTIGWHDTHGFHLVGFTPCQGKYCKVTSTNNGLLRARKEPFQMQRFQMQRNPTDFWKQCLMSPDVWSSQLLVGLSSDKNVGLTNMVVCLRARRFWNSCRYDFKQIRCACQNIHACVYMYIPQCEYKCTIYMCKYTTYIPLCARSSHLGRPRLGPGRVAIDCAFIISLHRWVYPLVNSLRTWKWPSRNSGFTHCKWWLSHQFFVCLPEGMSIGSSSINL